MAERAVITGVGAATRMGVGVDALWDGLFQSPQYPMNMDVPDFDAVKALGPRVARRADLYEQLGRVAAQEAIAMSGAPDDVPPERRSVTCASVYGGMDTLFQQLDVKEAKGSQFVSPLLNNMWHTTALSVVLTIEYDCRGQSRSVSTACAAGTEVIIEAARLITSGEIDWVLAGASDSGSRGIFLESFYNIGNAISPDGTVRPFDRDRNGFLPCETAGMLVVESLTSAQRRGATILAEVIGGGGSADAYHFADPHPEGRGVIQCINMALRNANVDAKDIGWISPHASGTRLNDRAEATALYSIFGDAVPTAAAKGAVGHGFAAAGAVEAIIAVTSMQKGVIPPTPGFSNRDPEMPPIQIMTAPREWEPTTILSCNSGFGGQNSALVLRAMNP